MERRIEQVSVDEGYRRWAKDYDDYENPLIAVEEAEVRRMLGPLAGARVLDAACGTGRHARWMCAQGARVEGVDANDEMLALARAKCPAATLRKGSVLALDAEGGTFDVVLCALMAEHVEHLDVLLASLCRKVAPSGRLVLSVWHPFMVLRGVLTHYEDDATGIESVLPTFLHLPSAYVRGLAALGFAIDDMSEPLADDALIARMPHVRKHRGFPLALVLRASATSETRR